MDSGTQLKKVKNWKDVERREREFIKTLIVEAMNWNYTAVITESEAEDIYKSALDINLNGISIVNN
ncbi:MAG TPA: hypothetical protein VEA37_13030 [Flavobacterium sp.]|nr:hypothetical protein [Flavobacterium sp.]